LYRKKNKDENKEGKNVKKFYIATRSKRDKQEFAIMENKRKD